MHGRLIYKNLLCNWCVISFTWIVSLQLLLLAQHTAKLQVLHTAFMYKKELYSLQGTNGFELSVHMHPPTETNLPCQNVHAMATCLSAMISNVKIPCQLHSSYLLPPSSHRYAMKFVLQELQGLMWNSSNFQWYIAQDLHCIIVIWGISILHNRPLPCSEGYLKLFIAPSPLTSSRLVPQFFFVEQPSLPLHQVILCTLRIPDLQSCAS